jgi:hypothetical protein
MYPTSLTGLTFAQNLTTGWFYVATIAPGSTGASSQIRCMDELITIDGISMNPETHSSLTARKVNAHLAGPLGSKVILSMRRKLTDSKHQVYAAALFRTDLEICATLKSAPFKDTSPSLESVHPRPFVGPIALRLVVVDKGIHMISQVRRHLLQLMHGAKERVFISWKTRLERQHQVRNSFQYLPFTRAYTLCPSLSSTTCMFTMMFNMHLCLLCLYLSTGADKCRKGNPENGE